MAQTRDLFVESELLELRKDGCWYSNGEEITHEGTCRAFFKHLVREGGSWVIRIGRESKPVQVEDTARFVTALSGSPSEGLEVKLSSGETEPLDAASLHYRTGRLTCRTADGEEARFLRVPYMDLMRHLEQDCDGYFVVVKGQAFRLAGPNGS